MRCRTPSAKYARRMTNPEHIISGCPIGKQFREKLGLTSMVGADVRNIHRTIPPRGFPKEEFAAFVALSCW
jgi:hypothetical protein